MTRTPTPAMIAAGERYIAAISDSDFPLDLGALYSVMAAQGMPLAEPRREGGSGAASPVRRMRPAPRPVQQQEDKV